MRFQVSDVEVGSAEFSKFLKDDNGDFLESVIGANNIRFQVNTGTIKSYFGPVSASPLLQAIHASFQYHLPLRIEPAYLWVTIIQEVATMVKLNPTKFAKVFNGDPANKKVVAVRCDDLLVSDSYWPVAIEMFRSALAEETGKELVEGFYPHFSSDDSVRELAYLVSIMDAASPYYEYEVWSMCGIPEIHLEGTVEDWRSLYRRIEWLEATFGGSEYFTRVKHLVGRIGRQVYANKPDVEFWKDIYKLNEMSGTASLTGWISDLYAHVSTCQGSFAKTTWGGEYSLDQFPSGMSVVDFKWVVYNDPRPMRFFSGFTGLAFGNGIVFPRIGYGVIEGEAEKN